MTVFGLVVSVRLSFLPLCPTALHSEVFFATLFSEGPPTSPNLLELSVFSVAHQNSP